MSQEILLHHAAVECHDQKSADLFYQTILGMQKKKSTLLSKGLSEAIFQIDAPVQFLSYESKHMRVEVFITESLHTHGYAHLCLEVETKDEFIARCTQHGAASFFAEKDGRLLLFVRDFSDNLYEIKYHS
jgi:catechol 2,3-dioxygenase-like lactoylglutathione lyase family enzyme